MFLLPLLLKSLETVTAPNYHRNRPGKQYQYADPAQCQNIHSFLPKYNSEDLNDNKIYDRSNGVALRTNRQMEITLKELLQSLKAGGLAAIAFTGIYGSSVAIHFWRGG